MTARAAVLAIVLAASVPTAAAAQRPAAERRALDVTHYDLTVDLPDTGTVIDARAELTVRRARSANTLRLDLIGMRVDSVLVDGRPVSFARDSAGLSVALSRSGADTLRIAVRYGGSPQDGLIIRTDSAGRWTAFGDNWPQRARYWIPSVDEPDDKATVTWTIRAPSSRRVVANGELVEELPLGRDAQGVSRTLTRWRESRPVPPYVMVIAAAPMAYVSLGRAACGRSDFGGCVRQAVYAAPEEADFLPGPFTEAPRIVDFFSRLVAPFPYEHLAHLQSSTRFGGMENATAIFYADALFRRRSLQPGIIAHETAHQWFGDAVTERTFADLWLSEGFATYWAALWTRESRGDSAFRAEMGHARDQVIASPVTAARPVRDTVEHDYTRLLNTNSYQKGAWVLHMLRGLVGDSAFFRGVRAYYEAHKHANATTDDLRAAVERTSGRSLGWFFDQWVRRPGYAELATRWRYDPGRRRVTLDVRQGARFAPYRVRLTIEILDAAGAVHRVTVPVAAVRSQRIVLPLALDAAPRTLRFDPDVQLLAAFTAF